MSIALSRDERIARNLAIGEKFYDGYHGSVARGYLDKVFEPVDFAPEWIFCSPYIAGEMQQTAESFLTEGAVANHATISQRIPDYKMDDFKAWPTERGCAWRWRVNGHGLDGQLYEFWEQLFVWTDDAGKVTRFEFYDDWHGFPQALVYAYDQALDEITHIEQYGDDPWTPGPPMTIDPPSAPPRDDPPANARVARNLDIATRFFEGYHESVARGSVDGVFEPDDFADEWVLFSPWFGETVHTSDSGYASTADVEHRKIWTRLPDYKMDDFEAWPTDDGCAWRWRVHGTTADGVHYEFWEQVFIDTDDAGKITRFEFYDDWQGFPPTLGYITGLPLAQLFDVANYAEWVAHA
jgi:hypothetical protein